ncbi:cytochrome P450 [Venturia nashicola]|uniref:Cytochrome P450 n=1 Tax=Venturia nashicola TaxID=86259 RepID=A0A4Z1NTA8_9PEZI|nr:cytochrome P450 [Venturia nashicola]
MTQGPPLTQDQLNEGKCPYLSTIAGAKKDGNGHSTTLIGLTILFCLYAIYKIYIYPFYISPLREVPEPSGARFPWGHADLIKKTANGEAFRKWVKEVPNQGLIRLRLLFNTERLLLTTPEAYKQLLVDNHHQIHKPEAPVFAISHLIGNGLIVAEGSEHRVNTATTTVDAYDLSSRVSLDMVASAGLGVDFEALSKPSGEKLKTYTDVFHEFPPMFFWQFIGTLEWIPMKWVFSLPLPSIRKIIPTANKLKGAGYSVIEERKAAMAQGQPGKPDILAIALESGEFSNDVVASQVISFLAAGHETTAATLSHAMYLLCKYPLVQERLRKEIRHFISTGSEGGGKFEGTGLETLSYLNAVTSEVLRLMPPLPSIVRVASADLTIVGQLVPKGTELILSPWATNVLEEFWGPDSDEFNPERWLNQGRFNGTGGAATNFANLVFFHGPRSCIGKDFAKVELLSVIAAWFGEFEFELVDPDEAYDYVGWVTIRPRDGLNVRARVAKG